MDSRHYTGGYFAIHLWQYTHLLQSETLTQVSFKELAQFYSTRASKSSGNLLEILEKTSLKKNNINH
ncbi:hypothetical protein [Colwellia sp. TT2012]|uniref:hypothetical protein n=1 Tax=Colwellia sp. TT2012 TaxID=1720342 RepID=UPI00070D6DDB|nr:hypothetical protein [Colwellia sp. TT2012]